MSVEHFTMFWKLCLEFHLSTCPAGEIFCNVCLFLVIASLGVSDSMMFSDVHSASPFNGICWEQLMKEGGLLWWGMGGRFKK